MTNTITTRHLKRFALIVPFVAYAIWRAGSTTPVQAGNLQVTNDAFTCTPTAIGVFTERVHVRCTPAAPGGIGFFAVCTTPDSAKASRFLSVFTTAKATAKNLVIFYTPSDLSGTACSCGTSDCRLTWGAEVQQ